MYSYLKIAFVEFVKKHGVESMIEGFEDFERFPIHKELFFLKLNKIAPNLWLTSTVKDPNDPSVEKLNIEWDFTYRRSVVL